MGGIIGSLLILGVLFLDQTVGAYPTPVDFDGQLLRWPIHPDEPVVTYGIEGRDHDIALYEPFVDEAALMWTEVSSSYFELEKAADGAQPQIRIKLKSEIAGGGFSAGFAEFLEDDEGNVAGCQIEIQIPSNLSLHSFSKTALHEMGHCLGLGHSLVPEAIMSYSLEKNSFDLDLDDIAAVSRLYPMDGLDPQLPPGCGLGHIRSGWALLLLPLLWPLKRKKGSSQN